jgi:hypothetical protein
MSTGHKRPIELLKGTLKQNSSTTTVVQIRASVLPHTDASPSSSRKDHEQNHQFQNLLRAYPVGAAMAIEGAERLFGALSIEDRLMAIRCAKVYADDLKRTGRIYPKDIANWLKNREFERVQRVVDSTAEANSLPNPYVFVAEGTPAWDAWVRHGHKPKLTTNEATSKQTGWWFPSRFPPAASERPPPEPDPRRAFTPSSVVKDVEF